MAVSYSASDFRSAGLKLSSVHEYPSTFPLEKIRLFWVITQNELYRRVPRSVAREVCDYFLPLDRFFILLTETGVHAYGFTSGQTHRVDTHGYSYSNYSSYTQIDNLKLIVSQGTITYHLDLLSGQVTGRWQQLEKRLNAGILYYEGYVYLFGGNKSEIQIKLSKTAERLDFPGTCSWTAVPGQMLDARSDFTPCHYQRAIYLCGGNCRNIEIFNPTMLQFRAGLRDALEQMFAVSWVDDGLLTILSYNSTVRIKLWEGSLRAEKQSHQGVMVPPNSTPVRFRRFVYWANAKNRVKAILGARGVYFEIINFAN